MQDAQKEFQWPEVAPPIREQDCGFLLKILAGKGWMTAREILAVMGRENTESNRRSIRAVVEACEGKVAGGQLGYKLLEDLDLNEFHHYRNWMTAQANKMQKRVIQSDVLFYARKPVNPKPI